MYTRLLERSCLSDTRCVYISIVNRDHRPTIFPNIRPTKLDILLAAHLLLLLEPPFPDPLITALLTESYPALVHFARRIQSKASEIEPHILPAQGNTWRSLIPWSQSSHPKKSRKMTPVDIRFDRMHWGWIASSTGNVAAYLWASRLRLAITFPDDAEPVRNVRGEALSDQAERIEQPEAEGADQTSDDSISEGPITDGNETPPLEVYEAMVEQVG